MEENKQNPFPGNDNKPMRKGPKFNIYWVYGIIFVSLIILQFYTGSYNSNTQVKSFQEFRDDYLYQGKVDHVNVVNGSEVEVFLNKQAQQPETKGPLGMHSNNSGSPDFS
ncbi:MAG: ATP-dependent metallopeptidase FtsH/Yme1/Tma family protein, partial [Bacteroidetes bacterium]|nr:ATP-dependent metallopeptidase FtsH/Yme1/Tma family protein [Bacteroidota bacterium]